MVGRHTSGETAGSTLRYLSANPCPGGGLAIGMVWQPGMTRCIVGMESVYFYRLGKAGN